MHSSFLGVLILAASTVAVAQSPAPAPQTASKEVWQMQDSGTTASLRGIDSVDGTVAWASGTEGTVLRTIDGGAHWTKCAVPDADKDGATLDFRGVQAWDSDTAIVMASGPGDKSRLYNTTDSCKTWTLNFRNPDKDGFWDALLLEKNGPDGKRGTQGWLLGDPVDGAFTLYYTLDGKRWLRQRNNGLRADPTEQGAFAASNSSLYAIGVDVVFAGGGKAGANSYAGRQTEICLDACAAEEAGDYGNKHKWTRASVPVGGQSEGAGVFSIATKSALQIVGEKIQSPAVYVVVGGDYTKPTYGNRTAAWSSDAVHWTAPEKAPHGYRSTVQWSSTEKLWITAGTNGSDISRDDGRTWQPLDDGNWNALSLPFIVGPKGRIAKLNPAALPKQ